MGSALIVGAGIVAEIEIECGGGLDNAGDGCGAGTGGPLAVETTAGVGAGLTAGGFIGKFGAGCFAGSLGVDCFEDSEDLVPAVDLRDTAGCVFVDSVATDVGCGTFFVGIDLVALDADISRLLSKYFDMRSRLTCFRSSRTGSSSGSYLSRR